MKKTILLILFVSTIAGCYKDNELIPPTEESCIYTSLTCTDTLGNAKTTFSRYDKFYIVFHMTNKTGKDQDYVYSGPISEMYIAQNDSIYSRQWDGLMWTAVIRYGVLKAESTYTSKWLAPSNLTYQNLMLPVGDYYSNIFLFSKFNDVTIKYPQQVKITIESSVIVKKPNIYIYPLETKNLTVELEFPLGGRIMESEPKYTNGWNVVVSPSGKINNKYDFLFYESENPDAFQYTHGWIVKKDTLTSFFQNNLYGAGFRGREIDDFLEYWIQYLNDFPYYEIYPQFQKDIEKVICLKISDSPDAILRMFYVFVGADSNAKILPSPSIPKFERKGFIVAEWGGILK